MSIAVAHLIVKEVVVNWCLEVNCLVVCSCCVHDDEIKEFISFNNYVREDVFGLNLEHIELASNDWTERSV